MCRSPLRIRRMFNAIDTKHSKNQGKQYFNTVPCGKCPQCVKAKRNAWLFRLDKELERSFNPLFVTLTYNQENVPIGDNCFSLSKRDCQLFMKMLRFNYDKYYEKNYGKKAPKLVYYACGEYGSNTKRPHYHFILYNLAAPDLIHPSWGKGHTLSLPLKDGGVAYVLKYMSKPREKLKGKEPEFSLMSKKIGDNYLTNNAYSYHLSSVKNSYLTSKNGYKMPLPKYYKERLFIDEGLRNAVTSYMSERSLDALNRQILELKRIYPNNTENWYQNFVEHKLSLATFGERLNEVL